MSPDVAAQALDITAALCRRFEGLRSRPYLCPGGVATIGYGATRHLDRRPVTLFDLPLTAAEAQALLLATLRRDYLPGVLSACPEADTPERIAALADFAFNLGLGALRSSTLLRRARAGLWEDVPAELRRWVRGGGRVLPGLVARREAEAALVLA